MIEYPRRLSSSRRLSGFDVGPRWPPLPPPFDNGLVSHIPGGRLDQPATVSSPIG
jgi:hypothetical protein